MLHNVIHLPSDDCKSAWFLVFCFSLEKRTIHDFTPETRWYGRRVAPCASRLKYTNVQKKKKPLYQPTASPSRFTVSWNQCEGCWPDPNVAIQKQKDSSHQNVHRTPGFHPMGSSTEIHFKRAVMSLYKLWPRPSIIQHAVSPSCVWKTCMTEDYQLNTGVNY